MGPEPTLLIVTETLLNLERMLDCELIQSLQKDQETMRKVISCSGQDKLSCLS